MLKRKGASASSSTLTKQIRQPKKKPPKTKYKQNTISQTLNAKKAHTLDKVSLHTETYSALSEYLKEYKCRINLKGMDTRKTEKTILIQGPLGCGKTHLVRQLAADLNLRILELNASANRSKVSVLKILGEAAQTFSIEKGENSGTIIFVDDVDVVLEPDVGFYNGVKAVISGNKCPVVMTCETVPRFLSSLQVKVFKLDCFENSAIKLVGLMLGSGMPEISQEQLENVVNRTKGNFNIIANVARMKELSLAYGPDVLIENRSHVKFLNPEGYFEVLKDEYELGIEKPELFSLFLDNLQVLDIAEKCALKHELEGSYRVSGYYEGIEKTFLKYRNTDEEFLVERMSIKTDYQKIAREHLMQMGDTEDFVSYLQVLKEFPVNKHPSYLLRHIQKSDTTYFDIFLQKCYNNINPPQLFQSKPTTISHPKKLSATSFSYQLH